MAVKLFRESDYYTKDLSHDDYDKAERVSVELSKIFKKYKSTLFKFLSVSTDTWYEEILNEMKIGRPCIKHTFTIDINGRQTDCTLSHSNYNRWTVLCDIRVSIDSETGIRGIDLYQTMNDLVNDLSEVW